MAHYEPPHQDVRRLQIQLFSSLVLEELTVLHIGETPHYMEFLFDIYLFILLFYLFFFNFIFFFILFIYLFIFWF